MQPAARGLAYHSPLRHPNERHACKPGSAKHRSASKALVWKEVPTPAPGPGEVRIAIRAASLNFPDLLIVQGKYQVKPPLPFVPGSEFSGVVEAVGEGVTQPEGRRCGGRDRLHRRLCHAMPCVDAGKRAAAAAGLCARGRRGLRADLRHLAPRADRPRRAARPARPCWCSAPPAASAPRRSRSPRRRAPRHRRRIQRREVRLLPRARRRRDDQLRARRTCATR